MHQGRFTFISSMQECSSRKLLIAFLFQFLGLGFGIPNDSATSSHLIALSSSTCFDIVSKVMP